MIGRHSVMLKPDSVRRVTPPTTMIAKTSVEENKSQPPTAGGANIGITSFLFKVEVKRRGMHNEFLFDLLHKAEIRD